MRAETFRIQPFGPHSEAQIIMDIAGGATVEMEYVPEEEHEAHLISIIKLQGTDVDVFRMTADHPNMRKHTVILNEGLIAYDFHFERTIIALTDAPLKLKVENLDTVTHRFEAIIPYFLRSKAETADLERSAIEEIRAPIRY